MKNYSDVQLLKMLREDSEQAFREIYDRYWKVLYETAFRKTTAEDACDLVQDIFLYLWKNRHTIFLEVQLNTYLQAALYEKGPSLSFETALFVLFLRKIFDSNIPETHH